MKRTKLWLYAVLCVGQASMCFDRFDRASWSVMPWRPLGWAFVSLAVIIAGTLAFDLCRNKARA
jgi:hypothetical protein